MALVEATTMAGTPCRPPRRTSLSVSLQASAPAAMGPVPSGALVSEEAAVPPRQLQAEPGTPPAMAHLSKAQELLELLALAKAYTTGAPM